MPLFRKKPVVVEANRVPVFEDFDAADHPVTEYIAVSLDLAEWCGGVIHMVDGNPNRIDIPTLEGVMSASPGDWIIKGVKDEFYPIKNEIFRETYDPVAER